MTENTRDESAESTETTDGADRTDATEGTDGSDRAKHALHHYLKTSRAALLFKLEGLSERDARWPVTPTGTNLLGLLKHCASVESEYFGFVLGRPFPEDLPWSGEDAEDNADMWAGPDESVASVVAFAERVWAHCDATIEALPLTAVGRVPWWGPNGAEATLGELLAHVLAEVSRHAGHADIVRESLDGARGWRKDIAMLPGGDEAWWAAYVDRLKDVALRADDPSKPRDARE
jgi:uncharacterized damage-inducible protein DinB